MVGRSWFPWLLRAAWVALPLTVGPAIDAALAGQPQAVRLVAGGELWALWAVLLVATLVPTPLGLTGLRAAAPVVVAAAAWADLSGRPSPAAMAAALAGAALAGALLALPETGLLMVNGPAYPNERRYPLRIPGPLLLGPLLLAEVLTVVPVPAGTLLLAGRHWVAGPLFLVAGLPLGWILGRSLHSLSRRWVVFVPAGLVLHDPLTVADPVLFVRSGVEALRPAPADSDSLDLTMAAPGLALELLLTEKVPMVLVRPGRSAGDRGSSARLLFTPTRPGAVLADGASRRLPVG